MPDERASVISRSRNERSAAASMNVASMTSPAKTGTASFSTLTEPSSATCSMRSVVSAATVVDCSFDRKSRSPIVAT